MMPIPAPAFFTVQTGMGRGRTHSDNVVVHIVDEAGYDEDGALIVTGACIGPGGAGAWISMAHGTNRRFGTLFDHFPTAPDDINTGAPITLCTSCRNGALPSVLERVGMTKAQGRRRA